MIRHRARVLAVVAAIAAIVAANTAVPASAERADPATEPSTSTNPLAGARVPRVAAAADAVTFDDFPAGTMITDQYRDRGLIFGVGSFITGDGANPTSPVLSGTPLFQGEIDIRVVDPATGSPSDASGAELDVGYIDNRNSVEISYYDRGGARLGVVRANAIGINRIRLPLAGIHRIHVDNTEDEPAGFAIDNLAINTTAPGARVERMIVLGDSYTSGEGYLEDEETKRGRTPVPYDCGTDLDAVGYHENTEWFYQQKLPAPFPDLRRGYSSAKNPCDTVTQKPISYADARDRAGDRYENTCHRHRQAWPNQVSRALSVEPQNLLFVACSGAVTENVGLLADHNKPKWPDSPNGVAGGQTQIENAEDFTERRGLPQLVTIGIGGNDAGFEGVVMGCLAPAINTIGLGTIDCTSFESSALSRINGEVYDKLVTTFTGLRTTFPDAAIVAYGYPSALQPELDCLLPTFTEGERRYLQERFLPALNQAIEDAAATAGITFVPLFDVTVGHEACVSANGEPPWINGIRWDDMVESVHPNQFAHNAMAEFFLEHYVDDDGRLLFANPEPNPTIRGTVGPITLTVGNLRADPTGRCGTDCLQPACSPTDCGLNLRGDGFAPNTDLRVRLYSDPVDLGQVTTDENGRLETTLPVPATVPDGEHRLEIAGVSADGVDQIATTPVVITRQTLIEAPPTGPTTTPPSPATSSTDTTPKPQGGAAPASDLASTGASVAIIAIAGLVALALGVVTVLATRRRRRPNMH